jgi:CubicO group peptidase (beta-lactamase class C family)
MSMELRPGTPEEVGMSVERLRHVVDLAEGWVAQGIHPALVVLVARRGVIVIHEAFGRLTPEQDSPPLELDTIFPLASITKPITATAAMILVEDGLLGLNRPVSWYIPEFVGEGKDAVMVHHLLTHTSGLRDEDMDAYAEKKKGTVEIPPPDETQHPGINEVLFLRYDAPLWKPPGTEMSYCSHGYVLIGEIIRRVSGRSLDDFARERIFKPLGMKDTFYIVPELVQHRVVKRPVDSPFTWYDTRGGQEMPHAAGGVYSTAMDTAVFGQMFLNRGIYGDARILSPASVAEMTRNQIPGISARSEDEFFPEASWGLGWSIHGSKRSWRRGTLHAPESFLHTGAGGVFLWVDPVYEIVGIYFCVSAELGGRDRQLDLFMDSVTAAVAVMDV